MEKSHLLIKIDKAEANPNAVNIAVLGDIGMFENEAAIFKRKREE